MSKDSGKEKIEKSIDGILGNLTIRGRDTKFTDARDEEVKKTTIDYMDQIEQLKKENNQLVGLISNLKYQQELFKQEKERLMDQISKLNEQKRNLRLEQMKSQQIIEGFEKENSVLTVKIEKLKKEKEKVSQELEDVKNKKNMGGTVDNSLQDRDKEAYKPTTVIRQYCEQSEGKRKLTIHLREIEYQAMLKVAHRFRSKGQFMDTITKALRYYIPKSYYLEAEREVSIKAIEAVRSVLENMGFSAEDIDKRLERVEVLGK